MEIGKSGYFDINGNRTFTIRIYWAEEYDIATNTSTLRITNVQAKSTLFNGLWFPKGTISVEGTAIKTMDYKYPATHAVRVYANETWGDLYPANPNIHGDDVFPWPAGEFVHETDGTRNVTFAVNLQLYRDDAIGVVLFNTSVVVPLTKIPRLSSLSASNGTLGKAQTLTVTKQADSFTHTVKYSCGNASGTICSKSSATSISWTPPISLAEQNTTSSSVAVTLTIETFSGSTSIGTKFVSITCSIPGSIIPNVSITTSDPTGNFTKFGGYVQNKSTCKVTLTASGNQGSTIKSYLISMSNRSYSASSATFDLPTSGSITITAKVTDSRDRTAEATATITVLEYANPTVSASAYRSDSSGNANPVGAYMSVKFTAAITALSSKNSYSYSVRYRLKGASGWTNVTPTASGYSPTNNVTVIEADPASSYEAQVVVADYFSSASSAISTVLSAYALVQLDKGNNRIGLGKLAEGKDVLDLGLSARFRYKVTFDHADNQYAPAGYGFGEAAIALNASRISSETELDAAIEAIYGAMAVHKTKLIRINGYPDKSDWNWYGFLFKSSPNNGSLMAHSAYGRGSLITKTKNGGTWQPLEWVNPPMLPDAEYRTTERFNGKAVYVKVFDFGALPNNSYKSLTHGLTTTAIVSLSACSQNGRYYFPSSYKTSSTTESVDVYINASNIMISTIGDWSAAPAYVIVKYTKD